jgi:hypothetical protein
MTGTTTNGIRYPNDPNAYADLIKFFTEMATDVDTKFVPKNAVNSSVSGTFTAKTLVSSNGGSTQGSTVLQTGPSSASAFTILDDNMRIDGSPGRRLWIAGANNTDVAIRTRSGSDNLNRISLRAATVDIQSNVTITGTLNVTGTKTVFANWEKDHTLTKNTTAWTAIPVTGVGMTFVAPPSGQVIIGFGGYVPTDATSVFLTYTIQEGATIGSGTLIRDKAPASWPTTQPPPHGLGANGTSAGSTQWVSCFAQYLQGSPLKAGFTYNIKPYYQNRNTIDLKLFRAYCMVQPDL